MPNTKRSSLTSKSLSNFTNLIDDDDWEYIEKDAKRTSSNFATLIDEIFEPEKFELAKREKAELQRKVQEAKRQSVNAQKINEDEFGSEVSDGMKELKKINDKVSSPLINYEFSQQELLQDIDTLLTNRYQLSSYTRPISRLDPGLTPVTETLPNNLKEKTALLQDTEKKIIETIRRSKFLGSLLNVRGGLSPGKSELAPIEESPIVSTTPLIYNDRMEPRRISDVEVPHFTRKSKHFTTANNRRSVLSLYAKDSIKDLNEFLIKEDPDLPPQGSTDNESRSEDPEIAESITDSRNIQYDEDDSKDGDNVNNDNILSDFPQGVGIS